MNATDVTREHLIRFTRRFIVKQHEYEEERNHHNQGVYFSGKIDAPVTGFDLANDQHICGTAGCVAGWGALFAGWFQCRTSWIEARNDEDMQRYWPSAEIQGKDKFNAYQRKMSTGEWYYESGDENVVNPANGEVMPMHNAARLEFGLSDEQAIVLFSGNNTVEEIDTMIDAFLADQNVDLGTLRDNLRRNDYDY